MVIVLCRFYLQCLGNWFRF